MVLLPLELYVILPNIYVLVNGLLLPKKPSHSAERSKVIDKVDSR
jgi:hypothetical protein